MGNTAPAATTTGAVPGAATDTTAGRLTRLRRNSVGISVMLLAQYGLGMGINLYVTLPHHVSMSHLPAVVTVHALFGLALLAAGFRVLIRTVTTRRPALILSSSTGLLAILAAAVSGTLFTSNGRAGASLAMALLTGLALLAYLTNAVLTASPTHR